MYLKFKMRHFQQILKIIKRNKKITIVKQPIKLTSYQPLTEQNRFNKSYEQTDTCWNWLGTLDRYGYGVFKNGRKSIKAHRYSYELHYGNFDKKLHVLHHCDNPRCVNPDHLFLGTNRDNVADRTAKKREGDTSRRLTAKEKECIKMALQDGQTVNHLAVEYKVHISTIKRLKAAIQSV